MLCRAAPGAAAHPPSRPIPQTRLCTHPSTSPFQRTPPSPPWQDTDIRHNEYNVKKDHLRLIKILGMRHRGPACFDYALYRQRNPDLPKWGDKDLWEHFVKFGQHEGRVFRCGGACVVAGRRGVCDRVLGWNVGGRVGSVGPCGCERRGMQGVGAGHGGCRRMQQPAAMPPLTWGHRSHEVHSMSNTSSFLASPGAGSGVRRPRAQPSLQQLARLAVAGRQAGRLPGSHKERRGRRPGRLRLPLLCWQAAARH